MNLAQFITENLDDILDEWERFAASVPGTGGMNREELRDSAREMLETIAEDMEEHQADEDTARSGYTSRADRPKGGAGEKHAVERLRMDFSIDQIMAEFQALRLSVMQRWIGDVGSADQAMLRQLTRFNQDIDRVLMESASKYTREVSTARELFLGIMGHDLRNPVGAMRISGAMLASDAESTVKQRRLGERIVKSGERVAKMLDDLMDFARARLGGEMPLTRESVDLRDLTQEVVEEVRVAHPTEIVQCQFDGDLKGSWDSERLIQLLTNLLTNAYKHGRSDASIGLHGYERDGRVRIDIHNEGAPIPERLQRAIFDPLVAVRRQKESSVSETGIGLGLYICKIIAKAHGGDVTVSSSESEGTTFSIELPREAPPERAEQQERRQ